MRSRFKRPKPNLAEQLQKRDHESRKACTWEGGGSWWNRGGCILAKTVNKWVLSLLSMWVLFKMEVSVLVITVIKRKHLEWKFANIFSCYFRKCICLTALVLVAARGIFVGFSLVTVHGLSCTEGIQGLGSLVRNRILVPCTGWWICNNWTTRKSFSCNFYCVWYYRCCTCNVPHLFHMVFVRISNLWWWTNIRGRILRSPSCSSSY